MSPLGLTSTLHQIHSRMPVIYDDAMGRQWLDPMFSGSSHYLRAVLQPFPSEPMTADDVSTLVVSRTKDNPDCI